MLDKKRILSKIDELDTYLNELIHIKPAKLKNISRLKKNAVASG